MKDKKALFLFFPVLFFFPPPLQGTPPGNESLRFDATSKWIGARFGYFPLFIKVSNKRETASYTVQVSKSSVRMKMVCKKTFRIEAGQSLSFVMNVPLVGREQYFWVEVLDAGGNLLQGLRKNVSPQKSTYEDSNFGLLVVQEESLRASLWEKKRAAEEAPYSGVRIRYEHLKPSELPPTWISYTGLSAVLIPLKEFLDLPSDKQRALAHWVAQGGSLCLSGVTRDEYSRKKLQNLFSGLNFSSYLSVPAQSLPYFFGRLHLLTEENPLENRVIQKRGSLEEAFEKELTSGNLSESFRNAFNSKFGTYPNQYNTKVKTIVPNQEWEIRAFGNLWTIKKEGFDLNVYQEVASALEGIIKEDPSFSRMLYDIPYGQAWRELGLPATGLCLFLLIFFAFVLIPTSFFILRSQSRLILLYLVVPLFSFVITSFLFVYSFFAEGVQTKLQSYSVNFLDQEKNTLYGKNVFQVYSPLSPGTLSFSADTAVVVGRLSTIPFSGGRAYDPYSSTSENLSMRWEDGQAFESGWILPRDQAFLKSLYIKSSRRRILLEPQGKGFKVVNSLGVSIQKLGYKYGGEYYLLQRELSPGQEGLLEPIPRFQIGGSFSPKEFYYTSGSLADGTYLAEVDDWPDQELGLKGYKSIPGKHRLIGVRAFPKGKGN